MKANRIQRIAHEPYCFAGEPAFCEGYFAETVLPCVCGGREAVLAALGEVAIPAAPVPPRGRRAVSVRLLRSDAA